MTTASTTWEMVPAGNPPWTLLEAKVSKPPATMRTSRRRPPSAPSWLHRGGNQVYWKPLQQGWKKGEKKEPRRIGDPPLSFGEFIRTHPLKLFLNIAMLISHSPTPKYPHLYQWWRIK